MPENFVPDHSLNYQPNTEPYSYAPFKMSISKKVLIALAKLSPFIFAFLALFAAIIIINYFNILSLSYLYPKYFSSLPHRYDVIANKAALSSAHYLKLAEGYEIDAKLKTIKKDSISVEYKGKDVEFFLSPYLECNTNFVKKNKDNKDEFFSDVVDCNNVLKTENVGKKVNLGFSRNSDGYNIVTHFNIINIE